MSRAIITLFVTILHLKRPRAQNKGVAFRKRPKATLDRGSWANLARERKVRALEDQERIDKERAARRTDLPGTREVEQRRPLDLPSTIRLAAPGELKITFSNLEDIVAQMTQFAAAVVNDHDTMREMFERSS